MKSCVQVLSAVVGSLQHLFLVQSFKLQDALGASKVGLQRVQLRGALLVRET